MAEAKEMTIKPLWSTCTEYGDKGRAVVDTECVAKYGETRESDEQVDTEGMRPVWRKRKETHDFCRDEYNLANQTRKEANKRDRHNRAIRFQGNDASANGSNQMEWKKDSKWVERHISTQRDWRGNDP
jgi:hypothetical protein